MASPWKFLARLVSPRRQQRPENGSADDVTPELLAIVTPSEIAASKGSVSATDGLAGEELQPQDQADARLANPQRLEAVSNVQGTTDIEGTDLVEADEAAHSDDINAALVIPKPSLIDEGATPKSSRRSKSVKSLEAVPKPSPSIPAVSDDALNLDEEIRLLREHLASKFQLQNAQLKRMLERFER